MCLAASIAEDFSIHDLARRFVYWHNEAYVTATGVVFDIGISTAKAIRRLEEGVAPEAAGCAESIENGNGSLMRIAPLVFLIADKPEAERFQIAQAVSSITHAHSWSVASCYIFLRYLRKLLNGMEKYAAYAKLREDFSAGCAFIDAKTLAKFERILRQDISVLPEFAIRSGGFVIDTLEAALWCFLNTDNYRNALRIFASLRRIWLVNLARKYECEFVFGGGFLYLAPIKNRAKIIQHYATTLQTAFH